MRIAPMLSLAGLLLIVHLFALPTAEAVTVTIVQPSKKAIVKVGPKVQQVPSHGKLVKAVFRKATGKPTPLQHALMVEKAKKKRAELLLKMKQSRRKKAQTGTGVLRSHSSVQKHSMSSSIKKK